jgi:hypothetical protein
MINQIEKKQNLLLCLVLIFYSCLNMQPLQGQDTVGVAKAQFSIKVRRATTCNDDSPAVIVVSEAPKTENERKVENNKNEVEKNEVENIASYPRLSGGELALLPISLYTKSKYTTAKSKKNLYVVFQITIDEHGKATNIIYHDTNSRYLLSVLRRNLHQSSWQPARNAQGQNIAYTYPLQFITIPQYYDAKENYED